MVAVNAGEEVDVAVATTGVVVEERVGDDEGCVC